MPASKKPRKQYRPKVPAGFTQLPATFRYSTENETKLQLIPHAELEKFRRGLADESSWHTLACRLNWGYVMSEDFNEPEAMATMERGLEALRAVQDRHQRLGRWGTAGDEFAHIGDALNMTDEMQKRTTRKEQHIALSKVLKINQQQQKESQQ